MTNFAKGFHNYVSVFHHKTSVDYSFPIHFV